MPTTFVDIFTLLLIHYIQYHIFHMQGVANVRNSLWSNLKNIFNKFPSQGGEMKIATVEQFVKTALGEQSQQEIDYVMKNMFRLDSDGSGLVSFVELANFLFTRHCAQMSLQIFHKNGKMKFGSERKMTVEQFQKLLNQAWKFLNVGCPSQVAQQIFRDADVDKDGKITYVEYFQFIQKHICQSKSQYDGKVQPPAPPKPEPKDEGPQRFSRLRRYIWSQLLILYNAYVNGRNLEINDKQLRGLIQSILGDLSDQQMNFLLTGLFKLADKNIKFEPFAIIFIYLAAELGLSRYSKNQPSSNKTLNKDQFVVLFRNSFKFLNVARIRTDFLYKVFAKIDKNNDGLISFQQYLDWVKRFLAVLKYFGDQFWVYPDDDINYGVDNFLIIQKPIVKQVQAKQKFRYIKFNFSDYSFAIQVRKKMLESLIPFDRNRDKQFDEKQISQALITLLKENQHQIYYMVKNVFRYDRNDDGKVTYDQLTDFCVEQHFGQMSIQRLHRKKGNYTRWDKREMNKNEFSRTLNNALQSISIQAPQQILDLLWKEIDLDNDGWISYEVYFLFLKYYFGSQNIVFKKNVEVDEQEEWYLSLKGLSPLDKFVRLYMDQLRKLFMLYDYNKNLVFETDQIQSILEKVFQLDKSEISYIIYSFFRFDARQNKSATFEEMVAIVLQIFFIQIVIKRNHRDTRDLKFNLQDFIAIVYENSFFIRFRPDQQLLTLIFRIIDTNKDGWITITQYMDFIRKYLGRGLSIVDESPKKIKDVPKPSSVPGVSSEQLAFIEAIWGELKKYFDKYDIGTKEYLNQQEVKAFVVEVLHETSQRQLDYVFWNIFRIDPDGNRQVQFEQFAPFMLSHAGEIALQRWHKEQVKGKNNLNIGDLSVVFGNAFGFLVSMPKNQKTIELIYQRIGSGKDLTYGSYLGWITLALAKRFR